MLIAVVIEPNAQTEAAMNYAANVIVNSTANNLVGTSPNITT